MTTIDPNHPTTQMVADHWHKLCAVVVQQAGGHVVISIDDLKAIAGLNIVVQELNDGIHLTVVDTETAMRLAHQHGGLPS